MKKKPTAAGKGRGRQPPVPHPVATPPLFETPWPAGRPGVVWDPLGPQAVREFFKLLTHTKGEWAGRPFVPLDWQERIVDHVFGWRNADGTRLVREAYVSLPRKQGKTQLVAALALYLLCYDQEEGAEIVSAAGDRAQARIAFNLAREMVRRSPELSKRLEVMAHRIVYPKRGSWYEPVSHEAGLRHGANLAAAICDEIHVWKTRELYDVLLTSTAARRQPLVLSITTAGSDFETICRELHERTERISKGEIVEPSFYGVVYGAAPDQPWDDETTWHVANPSCDVTVPISYLRREAEKARTSPAYRTTFEQLHLNRWTQSVQSFLEVGAWDRSAGLQAGEDYAAWLARVRPALAGRVAYGGLDLASTTDLAAFALVFPPETEDESYKVLVRCYCPEDVVAERTRQGVPYAMWVEQGLLIASEGSVVDYEAIVADIEELAAEFSLQDIGFDPWNATAVSQELERRGLRPVEVRQSYQNMSPPTKELLRLVIAGRLEHGGNPLLRWQADALAVKAGPNDTVLPAKPKTGGARKKIDAITALILALSRATVAEGEAESVYDTRGILVL